jgi:hypothetical protein
VPGRILGPQHSELLEQVELQKRIAQFFRLKAIGPLRLILGIRPVFIVGNVEEQVRVGFGRTQFAPAGGVGVFSFVQLQNPSGSQVLVRVIRGLGDVTPGGAADDFQLRVACPALGGGVTGFPLDSRTGWAAGSSQAVVIASSNAAAPGTFIASEAVPTGGSTRECGEFSRGLILAPGTAICLLRSTANNTMNGSYVWTEEPV